MAPLSTHSRGPSTSFSHDPEPVLVNVKNVLHPDPEAARRRLYEDIDSVPHKKIKKICCIGAGYVGGPTCSVIAKHNPDVEVTIVDLSEARIKAWQTNDLPIHEPNLLETVQAARDSTSSRAANLFFSTAVKECIAAADLIFVSVNTPTKNTGAGKGRASELSYVESAIRMVAEVSTEDKIIVEKSTVPVRTAEAMREILLANCKPGVKFEILSNPEFLAEGTAIKNLEQPDRILIGSLNSEAGLAAAASLVEIYSAWVPREKIITTNLWSSELAKLAANCLLAQRISSINALSAICENTGADVAEVAFACGLDSRIGPKMLGASVGFGGSCLKKDILSLAYIAESVGLKEVSDYWRAINDMNEYQKTRFAKRIVDRLYGSLIGKRIAILGFAFKKDTGDCRESAAISIVHDLVLEGAEVTIYDPKAPASNIWWELEHVGLSKAEWEKKIIISDSAREACVRASAAVIVTEWDEFSNKNLEGPVVQINGPETTNGAKTNGVKKTNGVNGIKKSSRVDYAELASVMSKPMYVFDGRNIVDVGKLQDLGFRVECIGKVGTGRKIVVDFD